LVIFSIIENEMK